MPVALQNFHAAAAAAKTDNCLAPSIVSGRSRHEYKAEMDDNCLPTKRTNTSFSVLIDRGLSSTGIVGSNPTRSMGVCVYSVFMLRRGLVTG
jgi:hypothetical protein